LEGHGAKVPLNITEGSAHLRTILALLTMRTLFKPVVPIMIGALFIIGCSSNDVPSTEQTTEVAAVNEQAIPSGRIALKAANDRFVVCDLGASDAMQGSLKADREVVGPWETFQVVDLGNGRIALKADNGKYVCADRALGNVLVANRDSVSDWETFVVKMLSNDQLSLQTLEGKYVSADLAAEGERNGTLVADRDDVKEWETFRLQRDVPLPAVQ
jgi:hypothetical protein